MADFTDSLNNMVSAFEKNIFECTDLIELKVLKETLARDLPFYQHGSREVGVRVREMLITLDRRIFTIEDERQSANHSKTNPLEN